MVRPELQKQLVEGAEAMGIHLDPEAQGRMLEFCALLIKWNRAYNLTAITEPQQIVSLHLLDSLSVSPYLPNGRVIDVGSGGGLPGIPLAIIKPDQAFVLLDSNGKKTRFMVQAVGELGLKNVTVVNQRAEDYQPAELFDVIISRAFASVAAMVSQCGHLLGPGGRMLAMKGRPSPEELSAISGGFSVAEVIRLEIPGLNAERTLLMLERS